MASAICFRISVGKLKFNGDFDEWNINKDGCCWMLLGLNSKSLTSMGQANYMAMAGRNLERDMKLTLLEGQWNRRRSTTWGLFKQETGHFMLFPFLIFSVVDVGSAWVFDYWISISLWKDIVAQYGTLITHAWPMHRETQHLGSSPLQLSVCHL